MNQVDTNTKSSHGFDITSSPQSRPVLADKSNRKCIQSRPNKRTAKQNDSRYGWKDTINIKDYIELRSTNYFQRPKCDSDKDARPHQTTADDNCSGETADFISPSSGDKATPKLDFDRFLCKEGSVDETKLSLTKSVRGINTCSKEKENVRYCEINDTIRNKNIHHSFIKNKNQQQSGQKQFSQTLNYKPSLFGVVPGGEEFSPPRDSPRRNLAAKRSSIRKSTISGKASLQAPSNSACSVKRDSQISDNSINLAAGVLQQYPYHYQKQTDTTSKKRSIHGYTIKGSPLNDEVKHAHKYATSQGQRYRLNLPSKLEEAKNTHQRIENTKNSLLLNPVHGSKNDDKVRVSCDGYKTKLITSESHGKIYTRGMRKMNDELVKRRTIEEIAPKNFGTLTRTRGTVHGISRKGSVVLNSNPTNHRVPLSKLRHNRSVLRTGKGSRIDNQNKRSPELPTSPEKHLNDRDKTTSLLKEGQFTDGGTHRRTWHSGREDIVHYLTTHPRVINNETNYQGQNLRSSSEHRIGSFIYWESDTRVSLAGSTDYHNHNDSSLSRDVDGLINCVRYPLEIYEDSFSPDGENKVKSTSESCSVNDIPGPQGHALDDLDANQHNDSDINNTRDQILLCQTDYEIKGAQHFKENTSLTGNEILCHGDLKRLPPGNYNIRQDQGLIIRVQDNAAGGLPLISDFSGRHDFKEQRPYCGMNTQLEQTGNDSTEVGNGEPYVNESAKKELLTDNTGRKGNTNIKTIIDLNKTPQRKPVILQEENIKDISSITKENKAERKSVDKLVCSRVQNSNKNTTHVTLQAKPSISKESRVNQRQNREVIPIPPGAPKSRNAAGKTNRANVSSTCKRPGCKHLTLIGYKPEQKCSLAKHSQSYQKSLSSFTFPETANKDEKLACNSSSPVGSPSTIYTGENVSEDLEKVSDNTCCEIITHALCISEDFARQHESAADNINSDGCVRQSNVDGSIVSDKNVNKNNIKPIIVPVVDINGLDLQSSPNEEIKQSGSTPTELTFDSEKHENEGNDRKHGNDNRKSIMDPQTTNEMEIGCDNVLCDNNRGHQRGADQNSSVPNHSQLHGSKNEYKTRTKEFASIQDSVQPRQGSVPTVDSMNQQLDAEQNQHSTVKDISPDNEHKRTKTKDERAINLKSGKANTASLIIKDTGIQLKDDKESLTSKRKSCRQTINKQSTKSKLVNRQPGIAVSGVPVPKASKLSTTRTLASHSSSLTRGTAKSNGGSVCLSSPPESCGSSTKTFSDTSNSPRSSIERSSESNPDDTDKFSDSQIPQSPKLRIHQTKTSRQRAKNASHGTKDSPTESKHLILPVPTGKETIADRSSKISQKTPTMTRKNIPRDTTRVNSNIPSLAPKQKLNSAKVSPVLTKRTSNSPSVSRKSPLSPDMSKKKSTLSSAASRCDRRSSSASRSSKESTPDNTMNVCKKPTNTTSRATLHNAAEKASTNEKKYKSLLKGPSLGTSKSKIPSTSTHLQANSGQNKPVISTNVKTQRNAIPIRKVQLASSIKTPDGSPNMTRKTDKTQEKLAHKSNDHNQTSYMVKTRSTKHQQLNPVKTMCEKDKPNQSMEPDAKFATTKLGKIQSSSNNEYCVQSRKPTTQTSQGKSPSPARKTKNIVSPRVERKSTTKSPITNRKPAKDTISGSPKLHIREKPEGKSMLPKTLKRLPKAVENSSTLKIECGVNTEARAKDNALTRKSATGLISQDTKNKKTIPKAKIANAQNVSATSPTLTSKRVSPTSIPTATQSKPESGLPMKKLAKSNIGAKSNIPAPRTSTPALHNSSILPRKKLSTTKTTSSKNNIKPASDIKIKTDRKETGGNISSKNDKIKRMRNEITNKEGTATSSYLSSKSRNPQKLEYIETSDENRCILSMAVDGYRETKISISSNDPTRRYTTDNSQISSDVIEGKKKCEGIVSINSSSTLETNSGQKINEANKTRNISTSSEEFWSASDDESLGNISSRDLINSNKTQCVGPSQNSYQVRDLGNILENTLEESGVAKFKEDEENNFNKDHGEPSPVLVPHGYITETEAPTVQSNEEMAMRLPTIKQLRENQQCNYHVQVADDRETNQKSHSKSDDNDHAIAKTIPLFGNDVHKDSTDLIPSNITHPLNRELDSEVLTVNSVRLCKKDKNQYVSTDIETKLPELTNLRDYFDERNDNSKLQINEGSKGASQLVQLKKSFGNDHSKNTMDNLPNLSSENCVSAQQGTQDGLCSSNNETSDQKFSSEFLTLEKTLTAASEVKNTITLENVAPSCIESTSDFGPQVADYDKKLNSYQNADNCTSGETLSASEPNPTNQNISNLSNETRTDLESESSDTSDQEGFESFDSDDGDSIMENGNCNIKFPTDDKTITAYTNNNMEIQRGPTRRITRQRRIITRSELSVRYETITTKILSPEKRECAQESSETRASELSVKANEISQSSSCVVKPSCDGQVTSHTVFSKENGNFINDEESLSDHHIINRSSYFRDEQATRLNTILTEKEGENVDQYAQNYKKSNRQEVLTHCERASESDTQNVFASFVLEDKTGQSVVPKYSSNRLSDVNIVLKLQPEEDWPTIQGDSNKNTGDIEHEVNLTLNLNPGDQNNVSDSLTTYVTKSSSCESANSEDIKLCRISTGDNGSDYSKSESTTAEITDVNEFQYKQSGIKTQVHDFPTAHVSNRTNSEGFSDNKNHSESDVQSCNVTGDIPLDNLENLQYKNENSIRGTSNHEQINDDKTPTSFATCPIENKIETRTLPKYNDIDDEECNHVSDVADTQSPSVTDLDRGALPGGMSSTNQVKTTESVHTKPEHKDKFPAQSTDNVQDLITVSNSRETRMKNDMQTALKKERDRQGIRRFTATVCLQDVQESRIENRNKFRSRSKSPIGLKNEDGVESKQGVSCAEVNRVSEIRRTLMGKAAKINIPEPKIERNKPVSPSTQLNSRNSKWVNACGKWKRIPVDDDGNLLQGYLIPETVPVSSSTLSDIKEVTNEDKSKLEPCQNEEQTVPFSDKRAMFEKPKSKQPPKVLPKPSEAKRRTVVSCLQQWKGRVADRRSKEFDDKFDPTKDRKELPISEQSENISNANTQTCELFCHLESKEVAKPVCVGKANLQNSLGKSSEKMKRENGYDDEKTCTNISAPMAISENVMKEEMAEKHWHIDQLHDQMNEYRSSENKEKSNVKNNYSEIPLIDAETIDDLGTEQEENKEFHEKAKPDVDPCVLQETGESFLMRRDKVISRRKEMHSVRAAGVWDAVIDNEKIQPSKDTACNELEDSDDTTPTNTPKTRKTFVNQDNVDHESGPSRPHITPKLKAVKIKQEMFPLEGAQEHIKSVTDSLKESLKTLNNRENKQGSVKFYMDDSDDDHFNEQPNAECQFENKILYSPSLFGNYKNYQNQKHSNVGLHRNNGEYSEQRYISRQSDETGKADRGETVYPLSFGAWVEKGLG